jgi:hypothetical protein
MRIWIGWEDYLRRGLRDGVGRESSVSFFSLWWRIVADVFVGGNSVLQRVIGICGECRVLFHLRLGVQL